MAFDANILVPLAGIVLPLGLAMIGILTSHQQKMATLIRQNADVRDPRVDALTEEVRQLKELVQQQAIVVDNLTHRVEPVRLSGGNGT